MPMTITGLAEICRGMFEYNPNSGDLIWQKRVFSTPNATKAWNGRYAGKRAGGVNSRGYVTVSVNSRAILAHRIIWAIIHGRDPTEEIDHVNGIKTDNRLVNLREASSSQNTINTRIRVDNKSGFRGVVWHRATKKWSAQIKTKGAGQIYLGLFINKEDAVAAYDLAADKLHGEFRRKGSGD